MKIETETPIRPILLERLINHMFLASLAAKAAASAEMLESFKSVRVVVESRAMAFTISSGLNSKSISP